MKNNIKKITALTACVLSAATCLGAFAACKKDDGDGEKVTAVAAKAATCTGYGNIAFWIKGEKCYSDEACTKEIKPEETITQPLGHDYTNASYGHDADSHWLLCIRGCGEKDSEAEHVYVAGACVCGKDKPIDPSHTTHTPDTAWSKDATQHWHACTECGEPADAKADHVFDNGSCECGATNGFEGVELDTTAAVTRSDTASSIVLAGDTGTEISGVKLVKNISGLAVGDVFCVTYKINSDVAGEIAFETYEDGRNYQKTRLVAGENTIKAYGVVNALADGKVPAVLQLGNLGTAELRITEISGEKLTAAGVSDYNLFKHDDVSSATKTVNADGTVKIAATGDGEAWHLKLEKNVNLTQGKTYDMVYVVRFNDIGKNANTKYVVDGGAANFTNGNELCWYDKATGTAVLRYRFTANDTVNDKYACLEFGELTDASNPLDMDLLYINLTEVA